MRPAGAEGQSLIRDEMGNRPDTLLHAGETADERGLPGLPVPAGKIYVSGDDMDQNLAAAERESRPDEGEYVSVGTL